MQIFQNFLEMGAKGRNPTLNKMGFSLNKSNIMNLISVWYLILIYTYGIESNYLKILIIGNERKDAK